MAQKLIQTEMFPNPNEIHTKATLNNKRTHITFLNECSMRTCNMTFFSVIFSSTFDIVIYLRMCNFVRLFVWQDAAAFREFLLVKLINGEKATFFTPTFSRKRERTLEMLIKDLYEEYAHDTKMVSLT